MSEKLIKSEFNQELTEKMKQKLSDLLFQYKSAFETDNETLSTIIRHEANITIRVEKPYQPLLRTPACPEIPRAREALEGHIKELMDLGILRKLGHNEQVKVTTTVIIAWHNLKSKMVGEFGALNTYPIPERYPIPRIHEKLTKLSQAKFITSMDALRGFNQNVLRENSKELLRRKFHCEIYE
ncbi:hypothetical protein O181_083946 [Austropuccinia psidii MF-1]|uniref:Uncharacterized protein n=1 Tax=Austropuccinia psidii MF-1 TaxID=1389203 RepID=A0A9Q3FQ02_9BASI|nr:hypothetical protein [Austropuccinia psidii MF-1]